MIFLSERNIMEEKLLTRIEAAKILGIKPNTLVIWRLQGKPSPDFYKINGIIRYKESDIRAFIEASKQSGGANVKG